MNEPRTEEAAVAGRLPIKVGGVDVVLRVLTLEESDTWTGRFMGAANALKLPGEKDAAGKAPPLEDVLNGGPAQMLELVLAYDVDHVLDEADARKRMSRRELADALDQMVTAEFPFVEEPRSMLRAFGLPAETWVGLAAGVIDNMRSLYEAGSSMPMPSASGISPLPTSVDGSPASNSSSRGATTRSHSRNGRRRS